MIRRLTTISLALVFAATLFAADMKFFKKSAETVWNYRPELFNAAREVPDSLADKYSAVILMNLYYFDAKHELQENLHGDKTSTRRTIFVHRMVKLLDDNAVQEFSQHEFGQSVSKKVNNYTVMKKDNAFGARVHKPDGTVIDVDLSQSYAVTEGKKDKDKNAIKRKIDIPGLEPGDVFEYFLLNEDMVLEYDPDPMALEIVESYPTLESVIDMRFDPAVTVEYRAYNGAPALEESGDKENIRLTHTFTDLPVLTDKLYVNKQREIPFYIIYTLNNNSRYRYYPASMRRGGVRANIPVGTIYRDIAYTLADADYEGVGLPGKVKSAVSAYAKAHPEASRKQILEAAWTAAAYYNRTSDRAGYSDYWLALMFADLASKQKWADTVGVAFINDRFNVPTSGIVNYRQPDFGIWADNCLYLEKSIRKLPAGEYLPAYDGEEGALYLGKRQDFKTNPTPHVFKVPAVSAFKNRMTVEYDLRVTDESAIEGTAELTLTGVTKVYMAPFCKFEEWTSEVENYLGIPEGKRYKSKSYDPVERAKELEEGIGAFYNAGLLSGPEAEVKKPEILSRGLTPDNPVFKMRFDVNVSDAVADAAGELVVPVGRFAGNNTRVPDNERERQTDIHHQFAGQNNYDIKLRLPEGYEADPASLAALSTNVVNPLGMFYAEAVVGEEPGTVLVHVREKAKYLLVPIGAWQAQLDLLDAAAAFNDATLIIRPVQ